MAPILAGVALLYQGYEAVAANQVSQKAKGTASATLAKQNAVPANEASAASAAAATAKARTTAQAKGATGQSATILTGPSGAGAAPVQRKTLLGQ
jgi:hypothetical protein